MADNALVVNVGTSLVMASDDISSVHHPRVKISVGADGVAADWTGSITAVAEVHTAGTVTELPDLPGGTVDSIVLGSIDTLAIGRRHADEFATAVASGTVVLGTIKPAVSGSQIFVTNLVVSVQAASNVEIASGGTSTRIAGTFFFAGSGGAVIGPLDPPIRTVAGSALVYKQSVDTGLSITAVGYVD